MPPPLTSKYSVELGFSFNKNLGSNLELWRNAVMNQDIDCVVLVDGVEGGGKSVHGMQVAVFLDVDRKIDLKTQVCYTPEDLKKAITTLPKFKAIVFDEAGRGFNRRSSTEKTNIELVNLFRECRQNNLFLIVIMPSFYDMDMNMAVWRSRVLIHIDYKWDVSDRDKPLNRGLARFYNEAGKKTLHCNKALRQQYSYPFLKNKCFDYTFPHHYVVDEEEYRNLKRKSEEDYRVSHTVNPKPSCPVCGAKDVRTSTKGLCNCRTCGHNWEREARVVTNIKTKGIKEDK